MRKLIYVPIVHAAADMGSLLGSAKTEFLKRYGPREWQEHVETIQRFWDALGQRIAGLHLDYARTCVYQDGLPVCGKELDIVTDLARRGSQNHKLILWLVNQGATLVGTEAPKILLEEYELMRNILTAAEGEQKQAALTVYRRKADELLARRDAYIRQRIDATLPSDGIGLLFIGLMHQVDQGLPEDISVSYLPHNLPSGEQPTSGDSATRMKHEDP